jgi:hypothetical protein
MSLENVQHDQEPLTFLMREKSPAGINAPDAAFVGRF